MPPSSDSSPSNSTSSTLRRVTTPLAARTPSAIGRSNEDPAFRISAGARLTVTRCSGNSKPELRIALRTRSRLSRTDGSGRPTIVKPGRPKDTSTSTSTVQASIPNTAAVLTQASIATRPMQVRGRTTLLRVCVPGCRRSQVLHWRAPQDLASPANLLDDLQPGTDRERVAAKLIPRLELRNGCVEQFGD